VLYELHIGAFSPTGDFAGAVPALEALRGLGVTAVVLMPVGQFRGARSWGYEASNPFAVQSSYGGPDELRRLVDAAHQAGLSVVVDLGFGRRGGDVEALGAFGPYFTDAHRWNLDGAHSDEVRRYLIESALLWIRDYHADAVRVPHADALATPSARPFLSELTTAIHAESERLGRRILALATSDANDESMVRRTSQGGQGFDAQSSHDFHRAVHAALTGESEGPYGDFGHLGDIGRAWSNGFVYEGQHSRWRGRRHGRPARGVPGQRFVVCVQDHDHLGARRGGERLSTSRGLPACRLAAGLVLLSAQLPLLFMGEEYGELAPFLPFGAEAEGPFVQSRLDHDLRRQGGHAELRALYAELLRLRRDLPALVDPDPTQCQVYANEARRWLIAARWSGGRPELFLAFHFSEDPADLVLGLPPGRWRTRMDSADRRWGGEGSRVPDEVDSNGEVTLPLAAHSFVVLERA
jgi:maltooligosyltrehalose trehalohydrolase